MTSSSSLPNTWRLKHKGPSPGVVAVVFVLLFLAGLYPATAFNGTPAFPGPLQPIEIIVWYFRARLADVPLCAALQLGVSVPLGIFTATVISR